MAKRDPNIDAHLEWIGFVRPTGLVVSAPALVRAGAILPRDPEGQRRLRACVAERRFHPDHEPEPWLPDFRAFASTVLGWSFSPKGYAGTDESPIPPELETPLQEGGEVLRPDFAVRERDPREDASPWQFLVQVFEPGEDFDRVAGGAGRLEVSAHGRMERLLRQTGVPAGLLTNGRSLRIVSAPRGESSGWLDLHVADMVTTAGRPIVAALRLLLGQTRLLSLPRDKRFAALLADSRRFQNEVSERLAEQVLHALYELLRGFQAANDTSRGALLREPLGERPDDVYHALLTVILRLVFLLYAEERDLLPGGETFARHYSLAGLYERLREDAALHPDTMHQRYGAWAQLLVLFRLFHDGAEADGLRLPPRHGDLFNPDRFPFLEGRLAGGARQIHERIDPPLVPDGTVYRALDKLLVLDGERISYRALDVEQIGSVYETMMGFRLETASGRSAAVRAAKRHGAPTTIDLEALLAQPFGSRAKWLQERTDRKLTDRVKRAVQAAETLEQLHAALDPVLDPHATPDLVPAGAMVLQPSEERRRSGSHYTPRELTEPIVRIALEPIMARLRSGGTGPPRPDAILDLKVCDPAMGSGAFLVETCRQLGEALIESWRAHSAAPALLPGEDEVIVARRLVAQKCLYGVDRNPVAVDLAKMSLWLATLARDHPLTFIDHALRHGDSLVGLSRRQIETFHWKGDAPEFQTGFEVMQVREHVERIAVLRRRIRDADESVPDRDVRDLWRRARDEIETVRLFGDLVVAAFFEGQKEKGRELRRNFYAALVGHGKAETRRDEMDDRRSAEPPLAPLHWEIEFPEVFARKVADPPGFDALVGNPPFAGKNTVAAANVTGYPAWLKAMHPESHGNADLVAHFFRRAFNLVHDSGTFGLIATNTIAQGDTRSTGLRWICMHGGEIYHVRRRLRWPGQAAVVVSVVHVHRGPIGGARRLDNTPADTITAFLFHRGGHEDPTRLEANARKSFQGSTLLGMGFTFDDTDKKRVASPLAEYRRLIAEDPHNREAIFPYIGGEEVNTSPTHAQHRYVINFRDYPLRRETLGKRWGSADEQQRRAWLRSGIVPLDYPDPVAADWPDLLAIVEEKVKPARLTDNRDLYRRRWWQYGEKRLELTSAIAGLERVLVIPQTSNVQGLAFLPSTIVFGHTLIVFPLVTYAAFALLQSRVHQGWSAFLGPTMKDDLRYTPSDCLDTFPFPSHWEDNRNLEAAGESYYCFRADLMLRNREGLTKTYNRFHDPHEYAADVETLRDLHAAMDATVLAAYGWDDIPTDCKFLPDLRVAEEGARGKTRYRWPDKVRDEVLARLLDLNAQRAAEEAGSGKAPIGARKDTEQPSAWTAADGADFSRAMEPRPLWGTSDE